MCYESTRLESLRFDSFHSSIAIRLHSGTHHCEHTWPPHMRAHRSRGDGTHVYEAMRIVEELFGRACDSLFAASYQR